MHEGYCSQFVCLSVCLLSVADLVPAYDALASSPEEGLGTRLTTRVQQIELTSQVFAELQRFSTDGFR